MGDDDSPGHEIAGPALVLLLALFVFFDDAVGFGLPAISSNEVAVVLHRFSPVVHEVLVHIVLVHQGLAGVVGEQVFGERCDHFFGVRSHLQPPQRLCTFLPPGSEVTVHARHEGKEFRVFVDRGFDGCLVHGKINIVGTIRFEQGGPQVRADRPEVPQVIDIAHWDSALQVTF